MATKLKPIYSIVAREMALGIDLRDICEARKLDLANTQRVARGDIFKAEVTRLQAVIETEIVQSAVEDPVLAKLKGLSYRAVGVLGDEMENYDDEAGASASTRISAGKAILEKAGYTGRSEGDDIGKVIILSLSQEKLDAVSKMTVSKSVLDNVPDSVDGHLKQLAQ